MMNGLVGLLLGVFGGLALRPVLDAYVLWRAAKELNEQSDELYDVELSRTEERDR